jgi:hypothetical protein
MQTQIDRCNFGTFVIPLAPFVRVEAQSPVEWRSIAATIEVEHITGIFFSCLSRSRCSASHKGVHEVRVARMGPCCFVLVELEDGNSTSRIESLATVGYFHRIRDRIVNESLEAIGGVNIARPAYCYYGAGASSLKFVLDFRFCDKIVARDLNTLQLRY